MPEHIRAAAREMNRKAFEERLRDGVAQIVVYWGNHSNITTIKLQMI